MSATKSLLTILGIGVVVIVFLILYTKSNSQTEDWLSSNNPVHNLSFKYPKDFGTPYITAQDWPPQMAIMDSPLACTEAGTPTARAGQTKMVNINNKPYCVTVEAEGAAGSTYRQYAYAREVGGRVVILTFTIREPQCANYDDIERAVCSADQSSFDLNGLIDQIFNTLKFTKS